jgi:hypothetical protein
MKSWKEMVSSKSKLISTRNFGKIKAQQLTIASWSMQTVGRGKDADETLVLQFKETDLGLRVNHTIGESLEEQFGENPDKWVGKKIALYIAKLDGAGEFSKGIRLKT